METPRELGLCWWTELSLPVEVVIVRALLLPLEKMDKFGKREEALGRRGPKAPPPKSAAAPPVASSREPDSVSFAGVTNPAKAVDGRSAGRDVDSLLRRKPVRTGSGEEPREPSPTLVVGRLFEIERINRVAARLRSDDFVSSIQACAVPGLAG